MQARVTCPACQTTLGVKAGCGEGTMLRCPKCRHEFPVHSTPAAGLAHDPLLQPLPPVAAHSTRQFVRR